MNPAVQAVVCGRRRQQVTETFTANTTWPAPLTTNRIDSATGKGGAGAPGLVTHSYDRYVESWHYINFAQVSHAPKSFQGHFSGSAPDDYWERVDDPTDSTGGSWTDFNWTFLEQSHTGTPSTGPSTTAFGQTFPGGTGGPATITTITNVAITPGASYNISVPPGGSLTITYFK